MTCECSKITIVGSAFVGGSYTDPFTSLELYESNKLADWGCISTDDGVNYTLDVDLQVGDGVEPTYLIEKGKNLIFTAGHGITVMPNALVDISADVWTLQQVETIMECTAFLCNEAGGKWELVGNQMIFYKTDGAELMRFNLFDDAGQPTMVNVFKRERVP